MSLTFEPYDWELIHKIADEELENGCSCGALDRIAKRLDQEDIYVDEVIAEHLMDYFD